MKSLNKPKGWFLYHFSHFADTLADYTKSDQTNELLRKQFERILKIKDLFDLLCANFKMGHRVLEIRVTISLLEQGTFRIKAL